MHDGIEGIGKEAFANCATLKGIDLTNVRVVDEMAFSCCYNLETLKNSSQLEKIGVQAFLDCSSLGGVDLPLVRVIEASGFAGCTNMKYVNLGKCMEALERSAFYYCTSLKWLRFDLGDKKISIASEVFDCCRQLTSIELAQSVHEFISSLGLAQWQDDINQEVDQINNALPDLNSSQKSVELSQWIHTIQSKIKCYKHMESTSLLELALWKASMSDIGEASVSEREKYRINCGAAVVIPNVLPFVEQ